MSEDTAQVTRVDMRAFAKERPRVGKGGGVYMRAEYKVLKARLAELHGPVTFTGLLSLHVAVFLKVPRSWSRHEHAAHIGGYCTSGPDLDNIIGAIQDTLWPEDDRHIVVINGEKRWGEADYMLITIRPLSPLILP